MQINGEDADVDGLDDIFVKLLEPFELAHLTFEPTIKLGVLDRDADVAGEQLEYFDVFA